MPVYTNVNATLWVAPDSFAPEYRFFGTARLDSISSPQATVTLPTAGTAVLTGADAMPWTGSLAVQGSFADVLHQYVNVKDLSILLVYGAGGNYVDFAACDRVLLIEGALIGSAATGVQNALGRGGGAVIETAFTLNARSVRALGAADRLHLLGEFPGCVVAITSTPEHIYALTAAADGAEHALVVYWTERYGRPRWRKRTLGSFAPPAMLKHYALQPLGEYMLVNTGAGPLALEVARSANCSLLAHPTSGKQLASTIRLWTDGDAIIVTDTEAWIVKRDLRCNLRTLALGSDSGVVSHNHGVLATHNDLDVLVRQANGRYVTTPLPQEQAALAALRCDMTGAGVAAMLESGSFQVTTDGGYYYHTRSDLGAKVLVAQLPSPSLCYAIIGGSDGSALAQSFNGGYEWRKADGDADLTCLHVTDNSLCLVGGQAASNGVRRDLYGWTGLDVSDYGCIFWAGATEWAMDKRSALML